MFDRVRTIAMREELNWPGVYLRFKRTPVFRRRRSVVTGCSKWGLLATIFNARAQTVITQLAVDRMKAAIVILNMTMLLLLLKPRLLDFCHEC